MILFHSDHLSGSDEVPGLKFVEIHPARHLLAVGVPTVPVCRPVFSHVMSGLQAAQHQLTDQPACHVINPYHYLFFRRQHEGYPRIRVERVGVVREQYTIFRLKLGYQFAQYLSTTAPSVSAILPSA